MKPTCVRTLLALAAIPFAFNSTAVAQTFDGMTPSEEDVCAGLAGGAYGICNAYCEAIDCDEREPGFRACESLRDNYFDLTGSALLPCDWSCPEVVDPTCSGNGALTLDENGCEVCACTADWSGAECTTCDVGFDNCGICGGPNVCAGR
jgi:hypothetical protein